LNNQAFKEQLEVEHKQGRETPEKIDKHTIRHWIDELIDAGLIVRVRDAQGRAIPLVFKCILADTDSSVSEKFAPSSRRSERQVSADDNAEVRDDDLPVEASNNNTSTDFSGDSSRQGLRLDSNEVSAANLEKSAPPPDTVITNTISRARSSTIPDGFGLSDEVLFRLKTGGVSVEVAEYFLDEFKAANESSGHCSFNWAAELVKYCKRWRWRYDKEHAESGGSINQSAKGRAAKAHERDRQLYEEAIAREQGDQNIYASEGEVRSQVVIPYRKR
jgi:hypothetical protein